MFNAIVASVVPYILFGAHRRAGATVGAAETYAWIVKPDPLVGGTYYAKTPATAKCKAARSANFAA